MAKNCAKMTGQTKKTFIYLYLARKSFKNQENIKRKREAANVLQKRKLFSQNGKAGISAVYFKDNFSHNIPELISATFRKVVFMEQRNKTSLASQ